MKSRFWIPETFDVFEKLKGSYRLGIYSEGTKKFQNYKFDALEIIHLLDDDLIFIVDLKTNPEAVSKIPKNSIVVDDKESVCDCLTNSGVKAIWLNKKDNQVSSKFQTIHSLTDLTKILL